MRRFVDSSHQAECKHLLPPCPSCCHNGCSHGDCHLDHCKHLLPAEPCPDCCREGCTKWSQRENAKKCQHDHCKHLLPKCPSCCESGHCNDVYEHRECNVYAHCKTICPLCCRSPHGCSGPGTYPSDVEKCNSEECRHLRPTPPPCPSCCRWRCSPVCNLHHCRPVCASPMGPCSWPGEK